MPDYSRSKIYKLQCDDGHFYIGSTKNELRKRLQDHKGDSKRHDSKVYQHINAIGWERVRIVLIEEFSCETRDELRRKEDEHIQLHENNPLCLNNNRTSFNTERRKCYEAHYNRTQRTHSQNKVLVDTNGNATS